jgi:hypothetical protein
MPAIIVGTAIIATQPLSFFITSFCATEIRDRLASRRWPAFARDVDHLIDANHVIINVAEVRSRILGDQLQVEAHQTIADIDQRGDSPLDFEQARFN